jgi:hypothetical protein
MNGGSELCIKSIFQGIEGDVIDAIPGRHACSPILKLLRASLPYFEGSLNWILGNGKNINIWDD